MKISEGGRGGPFERMDHNSLSRDLVIKLRWQMPIFLSISVCWFWFRLSQTRKWSPEEMGLLV